MIKFSREKVFIRESKKNLYFDRSRSNKKRKTKKENKKERETEKERNKT